MSRTATSLLIFVLASFAVPATRAQDRQAANREIYLYQGADPAQRLLSGARKEGGLSLYTTMTPEDAGPLVAAFEERYAIKVRMWRGINQKLVQRALAEARAGKSAVDVYEGSGHGMEILHREALLEKFWSPAFGDIPTEAFPRHGYYAPDNLLFFVMGYNTSLVKPQDRSGHTLMPELVAAGDIPMALTLYNQAVDKLKERGAPIDWKPLPPAFGRADGIGVAKQAPHPHAALLFVDFVLSPEGQRFIMAASRVPVNRKVESSFDQRSFRIVELAPVVDEWDTWERRWQALFLKGRK